MLIKGILTDPSRLWLMENFGVLSLDWMHGGWLHGGWLHDGWLHGGWVHGG